MYLVNVPSNDEPPQRRELAGTCSTLPQTPPLSFSRGQEKCLQVLQDIPSLPHHE